MCPHALRMLIMQVLASQLHFLANKNAELAIPPLFWPVNCIKIGGHVALLFIPYTVLQLHVVLPIIPCHKLVKSEMKLPPCTLVDQDPPLW